MSPIVLPITTRIPAFDEPDIHSKKPYIRNRGMVDGYDVWVVDGEYIRKHLNTEFNNFGSHGMFGALIPVKELWLDKEQSPDESKYYIRHMLVLEDGIKRGLPYSEARKIATDKEATMRARSKVPHGVYIRKLAEFCKDGCQVWLVSGEGVRKVLVSFVAGGHDLVYPQLIPPGEIWIDNDIVPEGRGYVYDHEIYERNRMKKGLTYPQAHEEAASIEQKLRFSDDKVPHWGKKTNHDHKMGMTRRVKRHVRRRDELPVAIKISRE